MSELKEKLRSYILDGLGLNLFGVGSMDNLQIYLHPEIKNATFGLNRVVVVGLRLSDRILNTIVDHPTLSYKHHYAQANYILDQASFKIANWIAELGYDALPIAASQVIDFEKQLGSFSHRHAGAEAGLGWIGRNGLLVNEKYGSQVRYTTIITNLPIDNDNPLTDSDCGECFACIRNCPANAISKDSFDYEKCFIQLNKFRSIRGIGHHICGMCVSSCSGTIFQDKKKS